MKNKFTLAVLVCILFFKSVSFAQNKSPFKNIQKFKLSELITENDYLPKTIVFKLSPKYRSIAQLNTIQHPQLQLVLNYLGVEKLEKKFPLHKTPEKEKNEFGQQYADLSLIYQLKYTNDIDIEYAANQLLATGAMVYAEPHYIFKFFDYEPNDTRADSVTGNQRNAFKRIRAYKAWDLSLGGSRGDANTVIAIVDSGSDLDHPDLAANIYKNLADPINGTDDDADGYTDNFNGWDLGGADYNTVVGDNNPNCVGANNNHGSHVSGCAAQVSDNNVGGAGIGFNCKLLIVKAAADNDTRGSGGVGYVIAGYEGITYAADHGAHIINCSWGCAGGGSFGQDIVDYATINKNALVIAAAGNDGQDLAYFPASYTYVLSVAATNSSSDGKATFSNYNYTVDLSAPGNQIDATIYNNNYTAQSGTSMASPIVAGAAGLVKSKFPNYTGLQIAERLKQTTDNNYRSFDAVTNPNITNPAATASSLQNKLGTGRLNAFRALVDPQGPSVVFQNENIIDNNDMAFVIGDTLFISGEFMNFLTATSNSSVASIKAISNGSYLTVIDTVFNLGALATMATTNNSSDPFKFKINTGTPLNTIITFRILIKDGSYFSNFYFNVTTNVDYINVGINDLQTTITSKSKIGWNQDGATEGLGFSYLGTQMLYEGGLMIGTSTSAVSDRVRGSNGTASDQDFTTTENVFRVVPSVRSEFDIHGVMNDFSASPTQNLLVSHNAYAWSTPGNRKYVIVEYFIKNNGTTALANLYAGISADWDIDAISYAKNRSDYDAARKMGYSWLTDVNGKYAGIKVLTPEAGNFYAIDNVAGGNGGLDIVDANNYYSTADKYTALSTPRLQAGVADADGEDVLNIMSSGPYNVNAGDSVKVAFALICGDDLIDVKKSADSAQVHYDVMYPVGLSQNTSLIESSLTVYPNPSNGRIYLDNFSNDSFEFELLNNLGQIVKTTTVNGLVTKQEIDVTNLTNGLYYYRINKDKGKIKDNNKQRVGKLIITGLR